MEMIRAVFVTHDHADHIKAVGGLGEKLNIPIYTTARIHEGINRSYCMTEKLYSSVRYLEKQQPMQLEDFHIESFEVPHDGTDNVGYCIEIDGKVINQHLLSVEYLEKGVKVEQIGEKSGKSLYKADFYYDDVYYLLIGELEKEEFDEIIKKMIF